MARRKTTRRAKKQQVTKIEQMVQYMTENPEATSREVCDKFTAYSSQVSQARKRIAAKASGSVATNGEGSNVFASLDALQKDVRIIKRMGIVRARQVISLMESIQGG